MRKSGGEPMSCGYSPTPPAACAWSAHSPSKPTKTGSKPTATSIWTNCASSRKPQYATPHDPPHARHYADITHTNQSVHPPTPPASCAWSAHSPSKPTKTGSKPTATSIWTNCASRRKPNYAKPHDQHHDRQFAELDAHNHGGYTAI